MVSIAGGVLAMHAYYWGARRLTAALAQRTRVDLYQRSKFWSWKPFL